MLRSCVKFIGAAGSPWFVGRLQVECEGSRSQDQFTYYPDKVNQTVQLMTKFAIILWSTNRDFQNDLPRMFLLAQSQCHLCCWE